MARLVKLSVVVPEDIDFALPNGRRFRVPGDVPFDSILQILGAGESKLHELMRALRTLDAVDLRKP